MRVDGYCTLGVDREFTLTVKALLAAMDTAGVDRAVIAPVPRQMAVANGEGNRRVAAAAAHSDRLIPTCTANPWHGRRAVAELQRRVAAGARMLVLDPAIQGFAVCDELAAPLLAAAAALNVPVYVHTGGYQFGTPGQLALAAQRFPAVRFILGHSGSTDFKLEALDVARLCPNVFPETSLARPFGALSLLRALGDRRVIMGSAAPLNDLAFEWGETLAVCPPKQYPGFYGRTLLRVLEGPAQ